MSLPNLLVLDAIREQDERQDYLEFLYAVDGRDDPGHPDHGIYSGLLSQRARALLALDRRTALRAPWRAQAQ